MSRHLTWLAVLCVSACTDTADGDSADVVDTFDAATEQTCRECSCTCADGHVFTDEACWDDTPPAGLCRVDRDPNQLDFESFCDAACAEHGGESRDDEVHDASVPPEDSDAAPQDAPPCDDTVCAQQGWESGWHCDGDRRVRCERVDSCVVEAESVACGGDTPACEPESATCVACIMHGQTRLCDQIAPALINVCAKRLPAVDWPLAAPLESVNLHWAAHFGPYGPYLTIEPATYTEVFPAYYPWGEGTNPSSGHNWIFVRQPNSDRWWGATFEGLSAVQQVHSGGNLNFEHENILEGTPLAAPWQPVAGEIYGFMISTGAYTERPGSNGELRSNIILAEWPAPS